MDDNVDLIVIGGGPAGSTLAALVAKCGHRVLLLEGLQFPRHKIGESLLPSSIHQFAALLGVREKMEQAKFPRKYGGTFRWGAAHDAWGFKFADGGAPSGRDFAYQVERSMFDLILLHNAREKGAVVRENCSVRRLLRDEGGRVVGVEFSDSNAPP